MVTVKAWRSIEDRRREPTLPVEEFKTGAKGCVREANRLALDLGEGAVAVIVHPSKGHTYACEVVGGRAYGRNPQGLF